MDHSNSDIVVIKNSHVTDTYLPGRDDYIKSHTYYLDNDLARVITFYGECHPISLEKLTITEEKIIEEFLEHIGEGCILKRVMMFEQSPKNDKTVKWTEEFYSADAKLPPGKQIARRKYFHLENRIFLTFHRNPGQLTAGYLHFLKPASPSAAIEAFHIYEPFGSEKEADLNAIFEKHMSDEQKIIAHAQNSHNEIQALLDNLFAQRENPGLVVSLFDEERNLDIVEQMKARDAAELEKFMSELLDPVDHTAPLLERLGKPADRVTPDEKLKLEEEAKAEITKLKEETEKSLQLKINALSLELETKKESQMKNEILQSEKDEINILQVQIEALRLRLSRLAAK